MLLIILLILFKYKQAERQRKKRQLQTPEEISRIKESNVKINLCTMLIISLLFYKL
jgi:hypothetical protein